MGKVLQFAAFDRLHFDAFNELGADDYLECGWIPPDKRDREATAACAAIDMTIDDLQIVGKSVNDNVTKVCLWDCWKPAFGRDYIGIRQLTGSCVGAGGGNALFSLACADVIKRRDPEKVHMPFWLLPYGISRMLGGLNGRGDGSFGQTFAQAVREYGHVPADLDGLPAWREDDGYVWGKGTEFDWSVGRVIPDKWLKEAKPYLVKSTARCRSADDVREAIKNYFPVTAASNWGGMMRPPVKSDRLLNRRVTSWGHQMSYHAWEDHPQLGEIFWEHNQWGIETHGRCPSGAPGGGFWVSKADVDWVCRNGEVYAFSQFDGFPGVEQPLDFSAF